MTEASPPPPSTRARIERASMPLLTKLHSLPRALVPLGTLVLVAVAAFAPQPVATIALMVVLAFVGWIAHLSWPVVTTSGRLLRICMLVLLVGLGVARL
jgi:hypothetical protein